MGGLGAWLVGLAPTLTRQVLLALGFGFVTFVGVDAALNAMLDAMRAAQVAMAPEVVALVAKAGFFKGFGLIAGALVARLGFLQLKRLVPT